MIIVIAKLEYGNDGDIVNYSDLNIFTDEIKANAWLEIKNKLQDWQYVVVSNVPIDPPEANIELVSYCRFSFKDPVEHFENVLTESYREVNDLQQKSGFADDLNGVLFWSTEGLDGINREFKSWLNVHKLEVESWHKAYKLEMKLRKISGQ